MDMPIEGVFHNLVIAKIKKDFAGQAQKVMNAMWGAGQMMFNKILVVADEGVTIQNYKELAHYVFKNLNPSTDIFTSTGPMDVLDHSCSKMGFGGKICIDGSNKFEEELLDENLFAEKSVITENFLKEKFKEIHSVNCQLISQEIPCLIISFTKNKKHHFNDLFNSIFSLKEIEGIKMILFVDEQIDVHDLTVALWRFCNNLEPRKDALILKRNSVQNAENLVSCIGLDGTTKTEEWDDFKRDWPNIIVADDATIQSVDTKWNNLGLGDFIPSPSLKFKTQMMGEEAIANTQLK
jgi:4-hydroxy-3-polyprenylbenzoate decarboxylase